MEQEGRGKPVDVKGKGEGGNVLGVWEVVVMGEYVFAYVVVIWTYFRLFANSELSMTS